MSNFLEALQTKIALLEDEKEEAEDTLARISSKLDVLKELLQEEAAGSAGAPSAPAEPSRIKRKPGRPKSKKPAPASRPVDPEVLEEAARLEGTDPQVAETIRQRGFSAAPRPATNYGPGIRVDQNLKRSSSAKSNAVISLEDEE